MTHHLFLPAVALRCNCGGDADGAYAAIRLLGRDQAMWGSWHLLPFLTLSSIAGRHLSSSLLPRA